MRLATVIKQFEGGFHQRYARQALPSHRHALSVIKDCRREASCVMKIQCNDCQNWTTCRIPADTVTVPIASIMNHRHG